MIFDSLKNCSLYYGISPRLRQAFEFLNNTDLAALEAGKHPVDGDNIYINVMERELKKPENAKLEVHNEYIDIQVLVKGEAESFGWSERADVKLPLGDFDTVKDIQLFDDKPQTYYTLRPGQFTILLPDDAHAPLVGEGTVKKVIVKVRK